MVNLKRNKGIIIFAFLSLLGTVINQVSYNMDNLCAGYTNENDCIKVAGYSHDKSILRMMIPIDNGRCCWNTIQNKCSYVQNPNPSYVAINNLKCGTQAEACAARKPENINDENACFTMLEPPYSCCFVRYRYHAECMPLDTHDTEIYSSIYHKLKAARGWKDPSDMTIVCASNFFNKKFIGFLIGITFALLF